MFPFNVPSALIYVNYIELPLCMKCAISHTRFWDVATGVSGEVRKSGTVQENY